MIFSILFSMLARGFGFCMWRLTLARGVLFLMSVEYSAVMCGAWPGTLVTLPWLRLSMIYCCALRLWSQICVTCRSYWFPDSVALYCCAGERCLVPEGWLHTYEMFCLFLFLGSFLNSCGYLTAKSETPPQETIFLPTYRYRAWVPTIPDHS